MAVVKYHEGSFPPKHLDWVRLVPLLGRANAAVARFEGLLRAVPNTDVLLSPLTKQEAVLSSRIEGTRATLGDVLQFEAAQESRSNEIRDDIQEIMNYRSALQHAVKAREKLPLSQRLIRDAHRVLMHGVRGQHKAPGDYRKIANWIGPVGGSLESARFVPPGPERVGDLMSAWEKFLVSEALDKLVQLAILHAEFEAIHPFLDGNGRMGRLLVPLFLVEKGLLTRPNFFISEYLESRRDEYYERLLSVSRDGDWTGWCEFFLTAVIEQANQNQAKAEAILELYRAKRDWMMKQTRSVLALRALDYFFEQPIFNMSDFSTTLGVHRQSATRLVRMAREGKIVKEIQPGSGQRPALLTFPELLKIVE